ncbi:hypothetical protein XELAEV_18014760mg [Xenopus laevis]|uniref:Uncharacterized protein n=1 Tax=Xenopus laevis TaxID=8355 RepID=A0A974HVB1_XENLA|nr:hypothetical protein XELAEV_18014760mg [Xenopus laevis]
MFMKNNHTLCSQIVSLPGPLCLLLCLEFWLNTFMETVMEQLRPHILDKKLKSLYLLNNVYEIPWDFCFLLMELGIWSNRYPFVQYMRGLSCVCAAEGKKSTENRTSSSCMIPA